MNLIVLVTKSYQEHIEDLKDFLWCICVSYHDLNTVIRPFQFPMGRCNDVLDNLGENYWKL